MNAQCTACKAVYRLDSRKIPGTGIRARCSECGAVIFVVATPAIERGPPADGGPDERVREEEQGGTMSPAGTPAGATASSRSGDGSQPAASAPRFGEQDPRARAQRLARALVSDMVAYHPERQTRGLDDGTLRQEFRDEIRKSWEEYVEQVGQEMAHGAPYFRDALNQILARGKQVF
jgi:predicted Zn finger-like uncharacterized protein